MKDLRKPNAPFITIGYGLWITTYAPIEVISDKMYMFTELQCA
ncbi:MAG: hypothetical protein ACLUE2_15855 [Bacteroides cellulosilyticus]